LIGNLGRDAETKFTPSGVAATRFSVVTSRRWKDKESEEWKEETNWTNVLVWRQEKLADYLVKGKQCMSKADCRRASYDDKDGKKVSATEVIADDVILLGGQAEGHGAGQQAARAAARAKASPATPADDFSEMHITDDDVPI